MLTQNCLIADGFDVCVQMHKNALVNKNEAIAQA